jgi:tRNA (mo5U34)-methyltransferase
VTIPAAPQDFLPAAFFEGIHWHQRWPLFQGIELPGRNPVGDIMVHAGVPQDLSGRRVLDIGAWNGGFSFECERRGAAEVIALSPEDPDTTGFNRIKAVLGSSARYVRGSVYNLSALDLGKFDLILFFGVLYHLRYPILALDQIRTVASGEVFIETYVIDPWLSGAEEPPGPVVRPDPIFNKLPIWRFFPRGELFGDYSNAFGPNTQAVCDAFSSSGFSISLVETWGDRASFVARPAEYVSRSYEALWVIRASVGLRPV